jgi:NAD(P)-dependent dehydrogenase (short-subunit alcohol dehydrogenase family)
MCKTSQPEVTITDKVVWVSGASSGLGRAAALALKSEGWRVVAGARSFAGDEGETDSGARLKLDVRDGASVLAFRDRALSLCGPPDALVNAAGILTLGPAEDLSDAEILAVMDTILLGSHRLVRAVLPLMRGKGGGKIAMLSSVNGLLPTPYQGAYAAAKHALEGYSECLMLETRGQNIQVMLVEPGDHSGGSMKYRGQAETVQPIYRESLKRVREVIARDEAGGGDPMDLGRKLARALGRKKLPVRMRVTTLTETFAIVMHDALPGRMFARFLSAHYKV